MKYRISNKINTKIIGISLALAMLLPVLSLAQNRGNALGFQGLDQLNLPSARIASLGGSYTAVSGDVNSLYMNPAGLAGLDKMQLSFTANSSKRTWRENQIYRPNRRFVTMAFYLEGLYVPDPANNGMWDHEVFYEGLLDTLYQVSLPDTGLMAYSKEAADWEYSKGNIGFSDISFALPLTVFNRNLTLAVGVRPQMPILDYDRNTTYLDPHIAYIEYGILPTADGTDTIRMNWYDFERSRNGSMFSVNAGAAMEVLPWLSAGFNMEYSSGWSDDVQQKTKVGYFDLYDDNQFMFSYDTLNTRYEGSSRFSSLKTNVGLLLSHERVSVGFNLNLPYTINRSFSYMKTVTDTLGFVNSDVSGTESLKAPLGFSLGLAFNPLENFMLSIEIAQTPFNNSVFTFSPDLEEFQRTWANQHTLAFGAEYKPLDYLAIRAGFRSVSQVFVPDGAAIITKGPEQISWSFGLGYTVGKLGTLDISYVMTDLKYYDQYFSNVNYVSETTGRWMLGYTISL